MLYVQLQHVLDFACLVHRCFFIVVVHAFILAGWCWLAGAGAGWCGAVMLLLEGDGVVLAVATMLQRFYSYHLQATPALHWLLAKYCNGKQDDKSIWLLLSLARY